MFQDKNHPKLKTLVETRPFYHITFPSKLALSHLVENRAVEGWGLEGGNL